MRQVENFFQNIRKLTEQKRGRLFLLALILIVGVFLRSYNLHSWLDFGSDQVKDFTVVSSVVVDHTPWPLLGPDMSHSAAHIAGERKRFFVGPMFYYFEIISAKIFGSYPDAMAYPDLLFSILSLPLFYYFLRRYFSIPSALVLISLYSISFYALSFSHRAWNVNSIPFFVLLFLLSLYELILAKEKTHWGWVVALGIALGVGVQLHAIVLVIFPATLLFYSFFLLKKNPNVWKKLGVIFVIALILNTGQILYEQKTGFQNSQVFLLSLKQPSRQSAYEKMTHDIVFHIQANAYILSSIGSNTVDFSVVDDLQHKLKAREIVKSIKIIFQPTFLVQTLLTLILSLCGYGLLINAFRKESDEKRRAFLGILLVYAAFTFVAFFSLDANLFRYFVHIFFLPFIFFGLLIDFLRRNLSKRIWLTTVILLFLFLVASNILSLYRTVAVYTEKNRTDLDSIILGELESSLDFMTDSGKNKEIYLLDENGQGLFLGSLSVVAGERNVRIILMDINTKIPKRIPLATSPVRMNADATVPKDVPLFYLGSSLENESQTAFGDHSVESYKNFGEVRIYRLKQN
ncbi:MAG: glycosyltransferase family 39 protein [Candidatus Moraniibacteriota bacterium]